MTLLFSLLAQTNMVEPVQAAALDAQAAVPPLNLWSLSLKGGFIMIPIVLLSLVTIYIFVERLLVLRDAARQDNTFMQRIKDYIHAGDVESALNAGMTGFVSKPIDVAYLYQELNSVLSNSKRD
mgnify:CR=1 FL=1